MGVSSSSMGQSELEDSGSLQKVGMNIGFERYDGTRLAAP